LSRKQQRSETRFVQRLYFLTSRLRAEKKQAADSYSLARDTRLSSFQSNSFASILSTTKSQQSLTLNCINYKIIEQSVTSAQDLNQLYNLQSGTNQLKQKMSSRLLMQERQQQNKEFVSYFTKNARLISTTSISAVLFVDNKFVFISNCNNVQEFFFDCFRVMHLLSLFQILLVAEKLYYNVKIYFENSCQNIIFDNYRTLLNSNNVELHNNLYNEFDLYCFTATMLKERKLHVEFCYALFKVSVLVEQIFRVEHSRTLVCFLEVFIYFIQIELSEIAFIFCNFIKKMFEKVTREEHS